MAEKKEIKEKEETTTENKKNIEKELYIVIGTMVGVFLVFFIVYFFLKSLAVFEYEGLKFDKMRIGDLLFYHFKVSLLKPNGGKVIYHFYLRTDPRKNDVKINGKIEFPRERPLFLSINESDELTRCQYRSVALGSLFHFLKNGAGFKVEFASHDEQLAKEKNLQYVTCENRPNDGVIIIQKSERTIINKVGIGSCYVINISNCDDFLKAIEKFQLQSILDARERI